MQNTWLHAAGLLCAGTTERTDGLLKRALMHQRIRGGKEGEGLGELWLWVILDYVCLSGRNGGDRLGVVGPII